MKSEFRKSLAVANWKMYLSAEQSLQAAKSFGAMWKTRKQEEVQVIICPSFPLLHRVKEILPKSLEMGARDVHEDTHGAYTGDVSVKQIQDLVRFVIVGHSERRKFHGDTDEIAAQKAQRALKAGLHPLICVGENEREKQGGKTIEKIKGQVNTIMENMSALDVSRMVFCYEPIWAISGGPGELKEQPEPGEVAEIAGLIRKLVADKGERRYAEKMRVLYGGSVTSKNVSPFVSEPGVDGVLVGGASTKPAEFSAIIKKIQECH